MEDIDVDGDIEDKRFLPDTKQAKGKGKNAPIGGERSRVRQKRKAVVLSDEDDDKDFTEQFKEHPEVDDSDFEPDTNSKPKASSSGKRKATASKEKRGQGGSGVRGGKGGKGKEKDAKEIQMKDERPGPIAASKDSRQLPVQLKEQEKLAKDDALKDPASLFSEPIASAPPNAAPDDDSKSLANTTSPPKKRKLPTIKKNKPLTGPSTPAASTPVHAPNKSTADNDLVNELLSGKKPAAFAGNAEVNLMNKNVYAELFKSVCPLGISVTPFRKLMEICRGGRRKYASFRTQ
jgi:hypothetical protein